MKTGTFHIAELLPVAMQALSEAESYTPTDQAAPRLSDGRKPQPHGSARSEVPPKSGMHELLMHIFETAR